MIFSMLPRVLAKCLALTLMPHSISSACLPAGCDVGERVGDEIDLIQIFGTEGKSGSTSSCSNVAELMWKELEAQGVDRAFGLPGGIVINFLRAKPTGIKWTNIGHEDQNGFAAQSYGLFKDDSAGVLVTTHGPGMAVAINSLYNAVAEQKPLLHIHQFKTTGPHNFQHWDARVVLSGITDFVFYLRDPLDTVKMTKAALQAAKQMRTATVLLVDDSLWGCEGASEQKKFSASEWPSADVTRIPYADAGHVSKVLSGKPKRPLIVLAGANKLSWRSAIERFLLRTGLPYVTTFKSRLVFSQGTGRYCGQLGTLGRTLAQYALHHARNVLIINPEAGGLGGESFYGRRFFIDTRILSNATKFIQLAVSQTWGFLELPDGQRTQNFVVQDIAKVLEGVVSTKDYAWNVVLEAAEKELGLKAPSPRTLLERYASAAAEIFATLSPEIAPSVVTGVGNHWYAVGKYMDVQSPASFYSPTNWASIGVAVANGLGLHYATGKAVWAFEGDGGAAWSAASYAYLLANPHVNLTVTIFLDATYSAVQTAEYICKDCQDVSACDHVSVPTANEVEAKISNLLHGPYVHRFSSLESYTEFLTAAPVADELRVLLVEFPPSRREDGDSMVYETNVDAAYVGALEASNFKKLRRLELEGVLFVDSS